MSFMDLDQSPGLDGALSRISLTEQYALNLEAAISRFPSIAPFMDSAFSPPLSEIELTDIDASEAELSSDSVRIYENADDMIRALHEMRARFREEAHT